MSIETLLKDSLKIIHIDPDTAECWLRTSKYRGQRPLNDRVVKRYAAEMVSGEWGLSESAIVLGLRDSGEHLLNGQHRLSAIVESGTTQQLYVHHRVFFSDHEMDLAYATMDRGAKRTMAAQIHALELGETLGVSEQCVRKAISALKLIATDFATELSYAHLNTLASPKVVETALLAWSKDIYAYQHAILGANKTVQGWFGRAAVMSIGLVTFRFSPDKASNFWHRIAQNDGLIPGSPEHQLYTFLSTSTPVASMKEQAQYARKVASAWNAYYDDKSLSRLQAYYGTVGIQINGTPWARRDSKVDTLELVGAK